MEETTETIKIRLACRNFLNTEQGRNLDPQFLIDQLQEAHLIDLVEADLLRSESSLPHRQFYFFLQILPVKSPEIVLQILELFRQSDQNDAKAFSDYLLETVSEIVERSAGRQYFAALSVSVEEHDGVDEGLILQRHFRTLTVEHGATGIGSAGDEVVTPDSEKIDLPIDDSRLKASDIQIKEPIGHGGYAVVFAGIYKGNQVAVKKFRNYDDLSLRMFIAEVNIIRNLDHPNLVKFIGYVKMIQDKQLWIVTEFIPGGSMRRFCTPPSEDNALKTLTMKEKLKIALGCWQGLAYLHSRNCCHKDLSPDNVLVSDDLTLIKISDFGLSEFKELMVTVATEATRGTAMYHPPEFATTNGAIRHPIKSDVYSMGASLCELFSQQWFWNHEGTKPKTMWQALYKVMEQQRRVEAHLPPNDPDCWNSVPDLVKPMLSDAINPVYQERKNANELRQMTEDLLRSSF